MSAEGNDNMATFNHVVILGHLGADPELRQHLHDVVLSAVRADTARAWTLQTDGTYVRAASTADSEPVNSQMVLLAHYTSADRTPV